MIDERRELLHVAQMAEPDNRDDQTPLGSINLSKCNLHTKLA
jgi:hypothetical protein